MAEEAHKKLIQTRIQHPSDAKKIFPWVFISMYKFYATIISVLTSLLTNEDSEVKMKELRDQMMS